MLTLQIKYQLPAPADPLDDPDYEPPPPPISNGFFAWFSPIVHMKEDEIISNAGKSHAFQPRHPAELRPRRSDVFAFSQTDAQPLLHRLHHGCASARLVYHLQLAQCPER